ncbi:MAG: stage III sporulation protein AB [Lachnospiraceae bacterium]|nr:stage III sporulation protein AB [Lachnospiraceae bacterium]
MVRIIGAILLIIGTSGMAYTYCFEQRLRLRLLHKMRDIFVLIQKEMEYLKATMPEICLHLSEQNNSLSSVFGDIYMETELNNGRSFNAIWRHHFAEKLKKEPLKEDEKNLIMLFPESLNYRDSDGQADGVKKYINELNSRINEIDAEIKNKNKVVMCLGVMSGIITVVIII